jgi:hypothetical protein
MFTTNDTMDTKVGSGFEKERGLVSFVSSVSFVVDHLTETAR